MSQLWIPCACPLCTWHGCPDNIFQVTLPSLPLAVYAPSNPCPIPHPGLTVDIAIGEGYAPGSLYVCAGATELTYAESGYQYIEGGFGPLTCEDCASAIVTLFFNTGTGYVEIGLIINHFLVGPNYVFDSVIWRLPIVDVPFTPGRCGPVDIPYYANSGSNSAYAPSVFGYDDATYEWVGA